MAQPVDGLYLNKYVDPQLLIERRNYRADFMQVLGSVPAGALAADGVRRNKLINNVGFRVNNTEDFEPKPERIISYRGKSTIRNPVPVRMTKSVISLLTSALLSV